MRKNGASERIVRGKGIELPRVDIQIPFMAGRPQREAVVNQDDIVNLQIACNTCNSIEEFIQVT
ncbi:MAG: hypothetical protein GX640_14015 [Fibrobacter sp.]|nr:hypothetical protein [Fibrobacter sp.]